MSPRLLLLLIYGGTGVTALAYEVLWTRMLSLMFGISTFGVVLTVAAFMAGLGLGSVWGARRAHIQAAPALLLLGVLEGGLAVYALAIPVLLPWLDQGLLAVGGGISLAGWQALQSAAAFLVLMPAATAMGFAFPMALRAAAAVRLSLGALYGINAIGGGIGALLPLMLLPLLGWRSALWFVAGIGLLLAAMAALLSRRLACVPEGRADSETRPARMHRPHVLDLAAYAGVGAAALMLEVVWTREYGMVLLRTEYVLAVLLFVYLLGIGLGSMLAPRLNASRWLAMLPPLAAALAIAAQYLLPYLSRWASQADYASLASAMLLQGGAVMLCTLPVTLALGAWLPLLAAREDGGKGLDSGGWWYGANCFGASAGALATGFLLLPWLGTAGSLILAACLLFVCGMRWAGSPRIWAALILILALAWPVRTLPEASHLLPALAGSTDLDVYEDAVALTHVIEQPDGQRLLLSDLQRMDASSEPTAVTVQKNQVRLPLLLRPRSESMLLLGLGTGITAAGSLPFGEMTRVAVELSRGAIAAARNWFAEVNGDIGSRMTILNDDARRFLRADRHAYDVIVGDLFHPDMVGRANLLSVQQFRRARERLNPGGVFVQWLALNQFDVDSLKVVMQSFRHAFDPDSGDFQALLFIDGYRIALVGVRGHLDADAMLAGFQALPAQARDQASGGEGLWTWLGRCWGEIPRFGRDVRLQDEWAPVIEYALPRVRYGGGVDALATWRWLLDWRQKDDRVAALLGLDGSETLRRVRAASAIDVRMWIAELAGDERRAVQWARLAMKANPKDRWPATLLADRMLESIAHGLPEGLDRPAALSRILKLRPDHPEALRAMLQWAREQRDAAAIEHWRRRLLAVSPLASEARQR